VIDKGLKSIAWSIGKFIEKGRLSEDKETILGRIESASDFSRAREVDLVIEAVFEKVEVKQELFRKLGEVCKRETLIASNTSAIPITELAAVARHPERVLGLHFFNPVPMMAVVEVIKGIVTSDSTIHAAVDFAKKIGKEPIIVTRDIAGFLLNRIHYAGYVEAIRLVEQGIGTPEDIDKGLKLALGRKMGVFETGDLTGLDVSLGGLTAIYEETKDLRFLPPTLLKRKVRAGHLGRKNGRGWYRYENDVRRK
jgi:3-hydroxybutyryl-CoA dehydrogenase